VSREFPISSLGKVLNFPATSSAVRSPRRDEDDLENDDPRREKASEKVDYVTDSVILDMWGGERLPGRSRLTGPGEILVLDSDGYLVWHNELEDQTAYEETLAREEGEDDGDRFWERGPGGDPTLPGADVMGYGRDFE
ncbi:hypothetical protein LCGC14_2901410, partial [marine sediment metagenome]